MPYIDAHQHFWKYDPIAYDWIDGEMGLLKRDFLPKDLKPLLDAGGISGCIAVQARQSLEETAFLLDLAEEHDFILGVVGWVDLQADDLEKQLDTLRSFHRLKGIRHIVQAEPDPEFLLREPFLRGVKALAKAGLVYDILVYERQLPSVVRFLERCPDQPMVLDHLGKPIIEGGPSRVWKEHIRAIAEHPQVYCKVSGLVTEADWGKWSPADFYPFLETVAEAFGPERLMVGSDWPVCLLAARDYAQVMELVHGFFKDWPEEAKNALYGGTAAKCYFQNDAVA